MLSVAFTGHRPNKLNGYNRSDNFKLIRVIRFEIERLYNLGYREFISGMALGVDQWAAEEVIDFRDTHPDVRLVAAIPCLGQESMWRPYSQREYRSILDRADEIVQVTNKPYEHKCMQVRNEYMVDRANVVLAVWDGTYGGTANCYNYAKKMMKEVIIINPNQLPNILGVKTQLRTDKISDMESLANQYPIIKEIDSYPYLQFLESKTIEELLEIKEMKNRQAHFNSQEAMRTGDSLRSSTGTRLFKEVHLITRFINLVKEQNESKEG